MFRIVPWLPLQDQIMSHTLTSERPRVSVVVVTHNSLTYLQTCLTSLYSHHDRSDLEVIVVDNESTDGTVAWVTQFLPEVHLIAVAAPNVADIDRDRGMQRTGLLTAHGFASANNYGLKIARGEYVLLLNPDTIFREASCLLVADYLDQNLTVGAAACQLRNTDGSIQLSCRAFPSIAGLFWKAILVGGALPKRLRPVYYQMRLWQHDSERSVDQPAGAFLMVRRAVLDKVGPLDERFLLYYEDVDWCYRIKSAGWSIMFWPGTSVIHVGGSSTHPIYAAAVRQSHLSMIIYFQKHFGKRAGTEARLLSLLSIPTHTVLWSIRYLILPAQRTWLRSMMGAHLRLLAFETRRLLGLRKHEIAYQSE